MTKRLDELAAAMIALVIGVAGVLGERRAQACGPLMPVAPKALPRTGATNVSTATSLIIVSLQQPTGLALVAGGQAVPLSGVVSLGGGVDAQAFRTQFWQVRAATPDGFLLPGAEHVLSASTAAGAVEATRFVTAAGYDKVEGTAPVVRGLRLWRVRYPVADIASGNCVFSEYHGFITVDYDPATVPNTAPDSVVHSFRLAPKNGGSDQTFLWTGAERFAGREPSGAYPLPVEPWQPELDPTRMYCLSISAFGDGDLARPPVDSGPPVCAQVTQLAAAGAPPPPTISGGGNDGGSGNDGGGCSVAGSGHGPDVAGLALVGVGWLGARIHRRRRRH